MKVFDVNIDDRAYHCKQMSAIDADRIAGILAAHDVLFLMEKKENAFAIIVSLLGNLTHEDRRTVINCTLQHVQTSDGEGGLMPVTDKFFNASNITSYYRLIAEVLVVNFQGLSGYLLAESSRAKQAVQNLIESTTMALQTERLAEEMQKIEQESVTETKPETPKPRKGRKQTK